MRVGVDEVGAAGDQAEGFEIFLAGAGDDFVRE